MTDSAKSTRKLDILVVQSDPRLHCAYTMDGTLGEEWERGTRHLKQTLDNLEGYRFRYLDDHERMLDELRASPPDLALNLCDMGYRNRWEQEAHIPALLEMLGIAYTGSDPTAIFLSADKSMVNLAASRMGVAIPNEIFVDLTADPLVMPMTYPALIKPNASGGSFGIEEESIVHDAAAAEEYLRWLARQLDRPEAVIQDYLTGREFSVGIIGNPETGLTVLPPVEVDFSRLDPELPPIQSYSWKADPDSPYLEKVQMIGAELDEITHAQLVDSAAKVLRRLGIRDYCRIDFRCGEDGAPRLLDVNSNPSWYYDSKLAMMAQWAGHDYGQMLTMIIEAAAVRCRLR